MKNLPTADRFSQKILKDFSKNRETLLEIEATKPYCHLLDPLLARDRELSEMLVECLIHEFDLKIKEKDE